MAMPSPVHQRRTLPPLNAAQLERLALRYVERFATTRGKLAAYLSRKVRERGWDGDAIDTMLVAERMAALGYVDDRAFAEARGAALSRRGFGVRRITTDWYAAGIDAEDTGTLMPMVEARAVEAAMTFARRKRIGPYGGGDTDRDGRQRQLAAMLRAGHGLDLARQIVALAPGEALPER